MYRFRDTASYLSKFANFDLLRPHLAPLLGITPLEFWKKISIGKLESSLGYNAALFASFYVVVLVEHQLVTDTHRHRQTHRHTAMAYTAQWIARAVKTQSLAERVSVCSKASGGVCPSTDLRYARVTDPTTAVGNAVSYAPFTLLV